MDGRGFDKLAKSLAAGGSRRAAVKALAGGVLGLGALAGLGSKGAAAATTCPNGKDTSCPDPCFCEDKVCKRCPRGYALRPSGRCKCALRNEDNCRQGRFAPKLAC